MTNKGHANSSVGIPKTNTSIAFLYVLKKAERLIAGIELVATIGQAGGLLIKIKDSGYSVLEKLTFLSCAPKPSDEIEHVERLIFHIVSLLTIARDARMLSPMNANILIDEYNLLSTTIRKHSENFSGEVLDAEYLSAHEFKGGATDEKKYKRTQLLVKDNRETQGVVQSIGQSSGPYSRIKSGPYSIKRDNKASSDHKVEKSNSRRNNIVRIIGQKGRVSIKDISSEIKDYSEKTIQRELLALVEEGVLIKEGERRWSSYSLRT